jgi:hypothetical protein
MEPSRLRSIVAFSAAATLLYTPLFKKLTAVKNATVATVVALAPLAGALAAGAVSAVLVLVAVCCLLFALLSWAVLCRVCVCVCVCVWRLCVCACVACVACVCVCVLEGGGCCLWGCCASSVLC